MSEDFIGPEIHERAYNTWGIRAQLLALIEELSEAAAAASRVINGKGTVDQLLEELVDVESLRLSVKDALGPEDLWVETQQRKRAKLLAKLNGGKK